MFSRRDRDDRFSKDKNVRVFHFVRVVRAIESFAR